MIILVLNCGSSSIKYQAMRMNGAGHTLLAKGLVDRIGQPSGEFQLRVPGRPDFTAERAFPDHTEGIRAMIEALTDPESGVLRSLDDIAAVGHRVAHGGEFFTDSALIDDDVIAKIRSCIELAPLHNPANLEGILSIRRLLPRVPQAAVFDTSFHQTIPPENYMYALPWKYYEQYRVRKFGFHGTSHRFVAEKGAEMTGTDLHKSRIITCHIGNGASITAVLNGRSFDTSMGFTPVDGLMMGTRTGSVDPGALLFIGETEGLSYAELGSLINKESGVLGVSGVSSDMRDITAAADSGNRRARLALDMYASRIKHFIGAYAALMGGVDLIVFTGGVGENQFRLRQEVCSGLGFLGVDFDAVANDGLRGEDRIITRPDSRVAVAVATTDEELVIARDTYRLTQ